MIGHPTNYPNDPHPPVDLTPQLASDFTTRVVHVVGPAACWCSHRFHAAEMAGEVAAGTFETAESRAVRLATEAPEERAAREADEALFNSGVVGR